MNVNLLTVVISLLLSSGFGACEHTAVRITKSSKSTAATSRLPLRRPRMQPVATAASAAGPMRLLPSSRNGINATLCFAARSL
jgi:hypothetical protein